MITFNKSLHLLFFRILSVAIFNVLSLNSVMALHTISTRGCSEGPLCVFVHGLDSYSGTWRDSIESLPFPCIAYDQRGCGRSEDLCDETFSQDALIDDLHQVIQQMDTSLEKEKPMVLIGHSLGARVVWGYAAKYPSDRLKAIVAEDMDIEPRKESIIPIRPFTGKYFQRKAKSKKEITERLLDYNYSLETIESWFAQGRVEETWSNANPDFR